MSRSSGGESGHEDEWRIVFASRKDIEQWDASNDDAPFTQTREFAAVKRNFNWTPRFVIANSVSEQVKMVILERKVPFVGSLWYIPCGPTPSDSTSLRSLLRSLRHFGKDYGVFLIKTEPRYVSHEIQTTLDNVDDLEKGTSVQPPSTLIVKLSSDDDFAMLGRRARRYARQAKAEGVVVKEAPALDVYCEAMYGLMQTANGGRGVPGQQSYEYYAYFWKKFHEYGTGSLFFAYEGERIVAGAYVIKRAKTIVYKDGGSVAQRASRGAAYYLHAEIMRHFAEKGFELYDMWGMPPTDKAGDASHPLFGIGQFKLAFSKDIIDHVGCYEYAVKPLAVRFWNLIGYRFVIRLTHWQRRGNFW